MAVGVPVRRPPCASGQPRPGRRAGSPDRRPTGVVNLPGIEHGAVGWHGAESHSHRRCRGVESHPPRAGATVRSDNAARARRSVHGSGASGASTRCSGVSHHFRLVLLRRVKQVHTFWPYQSNAI